MIFRDDLLSVVSQNTRAAFELIRSNPRPPEDATHYRLRGNLGTRLMNGRALEQWQIKVTCSGRISYLPEDDTRKVWVTYASAAHPKATG